MKLFYTYEMSFRIIDYFFDKFMWALTDTDPYEGKDLTSKSQLNIELSSLNSE